MKNFFALVAFTCAFVPALHSMEDLLESAAIELKNLKASHDDQDIADNVMNNPVIKRQKAEENTIPNNGLAKKIIYGPPVAKQATLHFGQTQLPQTVHKIKT